MPSRDGVSRSQIMELEDVKGVGPSAAQKLAAAGIEDVETLAGLDLRTVTIEGLSSENVGQMRDNAQRLLQARNGEGDLTLVEGLGPSAAKKLQAAGVETIDALVDLDLRSETVEGLSTENLQRLKRNAGFLTPES